MKATGLLVGAFSLLVGLASVSAGTLTIGALGDFGAAYKGAASASNELRVAHLITSWDPDFILTLGDNNYPRGETVSMDTNVGQFFHEYIHPYVGIFGAGAASNRFWPSLGNHDWGFPEQTLAGVQPHLDYFTLPGNERYYHYRQETVEIFAVSSDDAEPDGNTVDSVQADWLRQALAASTAPWRLVFFHNPPYSSGWLHGTWRNESEGAKMRLWPLGEWGASIVLTAHDHIYERIEVGGLTYFVCGTGGDRLDAVQDNPLVQGSQTNIVGVYGAMRIDATESNLTTRFIDVDGVVMDTCQLTAPDPIRFGTPFISQATFRVTVTGVPLGQPCQIRASSDLMQWDPVYTNTEGAGTFEFTDLVEPERPARFYRAVVP